MPMESLLRIGMNEFLSSSAKEKIQQAMENVSAAQRLASSFAEVCGSEKPFDLLKIGTVFQLFLVDTLAPGKKPAEFTDDDWKNIAQNVTQYAIMDGGQKYSEFVFSLYAQYIGMSVAALPSIVSEERREAINHLAEEIRTNLDQMNKGEITEPACIEGCLWLSLEAMVKLLCTYLTVLTGPDLSRLVEAVSQLAFEYGRLILFSREQTLLNEYLENQKLLDERLQKEYDEYLSEVRKEAGRFQTLVDAAFSSDIQSMLTHSAALARAAGVRENEILTTLDEIDDFFIG